LAYSTALTSVLRSSLLTTKSVDLVVADDGFLCAVESIEATLITEVLFEKILICIHVYITLDLAEDKA